MAREWKHDNASLMAAAVSFYATFSVAPLLVLSLTVAAAIVGPEAAKQEVVDSVAQFINPRTALAVQRLLAPAATKEGAGVTATSVVLLLVGASAVFRHLRVALNLVLDVPTVESPRWRTRVQGRVIAVVMVIATLALLLSSVVLTTLLANLRELTPEIPAADVAIWRGIEFLASTLAMAIVFAAILRFVPNVKVAWRHVRIAALAAAILFAAGRYLLGVYTANTNLAGMYGAAASLFVVLISTYFAVAVLFLAAELTEVLARRDAEFCAERARAQAEHGHAPRKGE